METEIKERPGGPPKGPLYQEGAVTEGDWGNFKNFSP